MSSSEQQPTRLWGGRFAEGPAPALAALSRSVHFDFRLAPYDLQQTRAHARVLQSAGLLTADELARIDDQTWRLQAAIASGDLLPDPQDEDVHTAVERWLIEALGELGGKLRAGRSRNDQVATDFRLYLRDQARAIAGAVIDLQEAFWAQAQRHVDAISPGFTHLQHARGKNVIFVCILDERLDDFNRKVFVPQIEGSKTSLEVPGIVDEVVTLAEIKAEDGSAYRAFVTHTVNPFGFPAKDRSGRLELLEPPDLGALIAKCAGQPTARPNPNTTNHQPTQE